MNRADTATRTASFTDPRGVTCTVTITTPTVGLWPTANKVAQDVAFDVATTLEEAPPF